MDEETKQRIDSLLNNYEKKLAEDKKQQEEAAALMDAFLERFTELRSTVIRPVLETIGREMTAHGHDYKVEERDEKYIMGEGKQDAAAIFRLYPKRADGKTYNSSNAPMLSFVCTTYQNKIEVHSYNTAPSKGMTGQLIGAYNPQEITPDLVEKIVMEVIQEIFSA